jgi:hypothetical protein
VCRKICNEQGSTSASSDSDDAVTQRGHCTDHDGSGSSTDVVSETDSDS